MLATAQAKDKANASRRAAIKAVAELALDDEGKFEQCSSADAFAQLADKLSRPLADQCKKRKWRV